MTRHDDPTDSEHGQREATDRVLRTAHGWKIRTREGIDVGPYDSELVARQRCELLVYALMIAADQDASSIIQQFIADDPELGDG